jgi:signal peptide peptidase SppA
MIPRFLSYCLNTPWAMDAAALSAYVSMLVRAYGQKAGALAMDDRYAGREPEAKASGAAGRPAGGIALIRVFGAIMQRASDFGPCEGGTGADDIGRAIDAAMADDTVGQILMQFGTPGGSVFGIQELGDKIRSARADKPIIGLADSMAASAGYWALSQCSEVYVTPGGVVGSIGVYTAHEDVSKALDEAGISITFISAGKYKVEGNPTEPLSDEARSAMQSQVDAYYAKFTQAVAKGRGVPVDKVRSDFGQGRLLMADDALAAGMVDGVMSFDQLVRKMASGSRSGRSSRASAKAAAAIAEVA